MRQTETRLVWERDFMSHFCDRATLTRLRIVGVILAVLMFAFLFHVAQLYLNPR